jgi:hypothetical protein
LGETSSNLGNIALDRKEEYQCEKEAVLRSKKSTFAPSKRLPASIVVDHSPMISGVDTVNNPAVSSFIGIRKDKLTSHMQFMITVRREFGSS